ncbi:MAG TPA: [FeFe] hydrogenase H-cluster maturation GTPase HydF [Candidatus Dorea gallistercoris]|uniref:[FeFe] hydrogenase H-cluster maturation GTPase HydF n=1 Tax=Candidatus Dorea gallistercoris TaxID=2838542 RepID=A0A9D1RA74_9FIRM|nr:[FeFe] hydrogenase H-cluster maturation GTPase HydF [Candidatus Dorea gallistercoris]
MSLNTTPSAERTHIGIFGRRNAGKSSLINALTGQSLAIVSEVKGTTTDPVLKAMELLPLGPVVMIDTPGLDDEGDLGALRIQKAYQILNKTDIAILVIDGTATPSQADLDILSRIQKKEIPFLVVLNKEDLISSPETTVKKAADFLQVPAEKLFLASASSGSHIQELKESIARLVPEEDQTRRIVADLVNPLDFVILVVPIDSAAPKGRLILPQQQTIRDLLETGAVSIVVRESELANTLAKLGRRPNLVITDSQAFQEVASIVPNDIPLTSFSILFARYKGNLELLATGAKTLDSLEDGDHILISEGCTHHRQCEDIGTVKLPRWIRTHTGKKLNFDFTSGTEFPLDLQRYRLIIHCGGCTLNEREMKYRLKCAEDAGVPLTNYGTTIAYMKGILARSLEIFS